jgi:hypothetical protein
MSAAAKVALDCNMPFTMLIKAQNGALVHSDMPHGQGPYAIASTSRCRCAGRPPRSSPRYSRGAR